MAQSSNSTTLPKPLQIAISKGRTDPAYFAEHLLGLQLHDGQKAYLRQANQKVNLLISANRWGKSVLMAVLHIWANFYKIGLTPGNRIAWERAAYSTVNLGPHSDTTLPVFKAIIAILQSSFPIPQEDGSLQNNHCLIGWFLKSDSLRNSVPYYIPYMNRSETLFRSTGEDQGTSIQGRNFGLITYDEGGRSKHLEHELSSNIIPRLADLNGSLHIPSTPDMASPSIVYHSDLFDKGQRHEQGYYSQSGSIAENYFLLRNNPTYIEDTKIQLRGNPIVDQVLYGKFVFGGSAVFSSIDVKNAIDNDLNEWQRYTKGHHYLIAIDTSIGEDECVYHVLDVTEKPFKLVRQRAIKGTEASPQMHMYDLEDLYHHYNQGGNCNIILETWNGESKRFYLDLPRPMQLKTKCFGSFQPIGVREMGNNSKVFRKAEILVALRKLLATGDIKIPNEPVLLKQLQTYREDDTNLKTDRVMALCLGAWMATDGKPRYTSIQPEYVNW